MDLKELATERLKELQSIGIQGVISEDYSMIELVNLSAKNIEYIENNIFFGFAKDESGKYFLRTKFADRPLGQTCWGLSFQQGFDAEQILDDVSKADYQRRIQILEGATKEKKLHILKTILSSIQAFGYTSIEDIKNDFQNRNFDFARHLFDEFGISGKKPKQVKNYDSAEDVVIFSGTTNAEEKIKRLKAGEYPFTDQSTFGFGYYFSDSLYTPMIYSQKSKENIIEARLDSSSRVFSEDDLEFVRPVLFEGLEDFKQVEVVNQILAFPEFKTLLCAVLGGDCLKAKSTYKVGETFYIPVNLECVKLTELPVLEEANASQKGN